MTHLIEGDVAPQFQSLNQHSKLISLSDFKNKKIILFFYPKDNTPGCTAQSCDLNNNYMDLKNKGYDIIGVSPDNEKSHVKFINKYNLSFNLIADVDKELCTTYGVWGKKKFMGREYEGVNRTTFIINQDHIIEKVFIKVNTKNHSQQIIESYK
jgi:peroxiredoxin Q/BCP